MECLIACGTSIAGKIAEYTVEPVGRQLGYIFLYRRNVGNLVKEIEDMNLKMKTMKLKVDKAKDGGEEIYDEIKDCLTKVDEISKEAETLLDKTGIKCSLMGSFSYLVERYQLSKGAKEMRDSVAEIKGKIRFDNISFRPKLQSIFGNKVHLPSATREKFMDEIMEVLRDSNIRTIGIHGMPGAGKTWLVEEIAKMALSKDRKLFHDAVIVTVSQTPNLEKIQQQIAERLGLKFDKEILYERALELRNRLKDETEFLIVIDYVWKELNLEEVGIVFESDHKGCKILITSRFERVLDTDMEVDKNFKVKLLSEDEALSWFNFIVGDAVKTREFQELGTKIVKKCGCLPLAIVTVGHSLKKQKLPKWRDVWTRLENSEQNEIVTSAIKLCYDILESDETKKLVSLCSLLELKEFRIEQNNMLMYLVNLTGQIHPCIVFGSLDTLYLHDLRNLIEICHWGTYTRLI